MVKPSDFAKLLGLIPESARMTINKGMVAAGVAFATVVFGSFLHQGAHRPRHWQDREKERRHPRHDGPQKPPYRGRH